MTTTSTPGRQYILTIWNDSEIAVDPTSLESLNWAKALIERGLKYSLPGEFKHTVATRQLADIDAAITVLTPPPAPKTTTIKTTPELNIGDIVHVHGCRLELTVYYYDGRICGEGDDVHTRGFKSKYLGPVNEGFDPIEAHGGYGHLMANDKWDVQGNHRASWAVEVAA